MLQMFLTYFYACCILLLYTPTVTGNLGELVMRSKRGDLEELRS